MLTLLTKSTTLLILFIIAVGCIFVVVIIIFVVRPVRHNGPVEKCRHEILHARVQRFFVAFWLLEWIWYENYKLLIYMAKQNFNQKNSRIKIAHKCPPLAGECCPSSRVTEPPTEKESGERKLYLWLYLWVGNSINNIGFPWSYGLTFVTPKNRWRIF